MGRTLGLPREEIVRPCSPPGSSACSSRSPRPSPPKSPGVRSSAARVSAWPPRGCAHARRDRGPVPRCRFDGPQNITGLACDPVANRVEVPCLGKNIMCGFNAVACANMALAGFDKVIRSTRPSPPSTTWGSCFPSICAAPSAASARPRPRSPSASA
ncbi:MAG: L-serine ammonia-lyase, iron-sulfur-dependent, subunit alpha [Bilophila wadsworthia]